VRTAAAILIVAACSVVACDSAIPRLSDADFVRSAALQELVEGSGRPFVCLWVHRGIVAVGTPFNDLSAVDDPLPPMLRHAQGMFAAVYPGSQCDRDGTNETVRHVPSGATGGAIVVLGPVLLRHGATEAQLLAETSRHLFCREVTHLRFERSGGYYDVRERTTRGRGVGCVVRQAGTCGLTMDWS
jgi:hypothetical protein